MTPEDFKTAHQEAAAREVARLAALRERQRLNAERRRQTRGPVLRMIMSLLQLWSAGAAYILTLAVILGLSLGMSAIVAYPISLALGLFAHYDDNERNLNDATFIVMIFIFPALAGRIFRAVQFDALFNARHSG
jgi:hypothetical protein